MNPNSMCDRECRKKSFKYHDIASAMVEDNGELHLINLCKDCYNLREGAGCERQALDASSH